MPALLRWSILKTTSHTAVHSCQSLFIKPITITCWLNLQLTDAYQYHLWTDTTQCSRQTANYFDFQRTNWFENRFIFPESTVTLIPSPLLLTPNSCHTVSFSPLPSPYRGRSDRASFRRPPLGVLNAPSPPARQLSSVNTREPAQGRRFSQRARAGGEPGVTVPSTLRTHCG